MDTYDAVKNLQNICLDKSKTYNGDGTDNWAYAFGAFTSEIQTLLDEMNLTESQMNVLINRVNKG